MDLKKQSLIDQAIDDLGGKWIGDAQKFNTLAKAGGVYFTYHSRSAPIPSICTYTEFMDRKAERQNKPSWKSASEWSHWLAQDASGHWWWYPKFKDAPTLASQCFVNGSVDRVIFAGKGEVIGDWRDTLEQRPNHIVEPDEKAASKAALEKAVKACERALREFDPIVSLGVQADWYDYERLTATRHPNRGVTVQVFYGPNDGTGCWVKCFVVGNSDKGELVLQHVGLEQSVSYLFCEHELHKIRPLDWDRNLQPKPEPEPSPELSFHLSTAFNELQASARLLPEDDPRKQMLVSLANGVSVVREGV